MRLARLVCFNMLLLFLVPGIAEGQAANGHEGFWIGFGIGGGSAKAENEEEALGGGAAYLRLGGTLSQRWLLGGEVMAWGRRENEVSYSRGNVSFTALFYPSATAGFYLKGGIGASYVDISTTIIGPVISVSKGGGGFVLGAGFDIKLGSNIYLTPNLDWMFQSIEVGDNATQKANVGLLTLGLVWH